MPRSGTTLVEQIIASHSKVMGAGELQYLDKSINENFLEDAKLNKQKLLEELSSEKNVILDRYFERGTVVLGKVEAGTLTMGDEIAIAPTKRVIKCDAIYINEEKVRSAKPGENVLIKFNCR